MLYLPLLLYAAAFTNFASDYGSPTKDKAVVMYFPDENGHPRAAIVDPNDDEENISNFADVLPPDYKKKPEKYIFFFLYTRRGKSKLSVGDVTSLHGSSFDASLPTKLVTHGYISSEQSTTVQSIKNKYLEVEDCNVIGVDWSKLAETINYNVAKRRTKLVASYTAKFIDFLVNEGKMNLADVHLIGHSLGAHVMGLTGKNVQSGKVSRITGLDPAGVLYNIKDETDRLTVGDAEFVDIIHTCGGKLAFHDPVGDVDFYPNVGRTPQPGCQHDVFGSCSHGRAWEFFAESIGSTAFKSVPCESYNKYKAGKCDHLPKASMGHPCPSDIRGNYYLTTTSKPPYALG